ncbi:MAG: hypothetical protein O7C67_06370 [Gammaproteobacteria bacterium]|nr:hypothetical protein [Gammaproteobacteria bacterium]
MCSESWRSLTERELAEVAGGGCNDCPRLEINPPKLMEFQNYAQVSEIAEPVWLPFA